jgi:hypothetical protein
VPYRVQADFAIVAFGYDGWIVFITNLMVISQPLVDSRHRRIRMLKRLPSVGGRCSYQSNLVVLSQPHCRFSATPKIQIIPSPQIFPSFNCSLFLITRPLLFLCGCGRYQSRLLVLYQPLYRFSTAPKPII